MAQTKKIIDEIVTKEQLPSVAQKILELLPHVKIFAFRGPLGAGKTTLIKQIGKLLEIHEPITSPTFTYMNQYESAHGPVYHFDLYRLKNAQEFLQAGFGEYLEQKEGLVFIEWPDVIDSILDSTCAHITIEHVDTDKRQLVVYCKQS